MVRLKAIALVMFVSTFIYSLTVIYDVESQPEQQPLGFKPSIITVEELSPVRAENE